MLKGTADAAQDGERRVTCARPAGYPEATVVRQHLLLGGIFDALDTQLLQRHQVSHILCLSAQSCSPAPMRSVLNIKIDGLAGHELLLQLQRAAASIEEVVAAANSAVVLVSCGDERGCTDYGPAVVVAHLAKVERTGVIEAFRDVRSRRPMCMMNPEQTILGALAALEEAIDNKRWVEPPSGVERATAARLLTIVDGEAETRPSLGTGPTPRSEDYVELPDDVVAHKNKIAEDLLTLHCPECGMAFLDFSGCFALLCPMCQCAFCAYCQKSCRLERNDAHEHVMRCEYNIGPVTSVGRSIFASHRVFEYSQNLRRMRSVTAYLKDLDAQNPRLRAAVMSAIKVDLQDLGINMSGEATGAWRIFVDEE